MVRIESRRPGTSSRPSRWLCTLAALLAALALLGAPASGAQVTRTATGARATRTLTYAGVSLTVPAGWPVLHLSGAHVCLRFDRHAVYLGRPASGVSCPGHAAGRTETILIEPRRPGAGPGLGRGGPATLVRRTRRAVVYATWRADATLIRRALGLRGLPRAPRSWPALGLHAARAAADRAAVPAAHAAAAPATSSTGTSTAGEIFTGGGFDACSAPSQTQMNAWASSPYRAIGVYIGGTNMACAQTNLTTTWLQTQAAAGWHMVPTYVGLQAPGNTCGCASIAPASAASEGSSAAQDAVAQAEALGLGPGNPIYFDMEAYPRNRTNTNAVLTFLSAWTQTLHGSGYLSGVYSSEDSGIADLAAAYGTGYLEPDEIWAANWNGAASTADSSVSSADWANHQRLHQYRGDHTESYAGTRLDIDSDYLDAATGAAGTGAPPATTATTAASTPTLAVVPASDGSIALTPSWTGGPAVASWQILAGATPNTMSPAGSPQSATGTTIVLHSAYAYLAVQGLDASGTILGTSNIVGMPPHLVLAGATAFVPASGVGAVPIACLSSATCHVSARITSGKVTLALTRSVPLAPGPAVLHFSLSAAARRTLVRLHHETVLVRLRDTGANTTAVKAMSLQLFHTSGPSPARTATAAPSLAVLGLTDYVSNGWTGGILSTCRAGTPCTIATVLTIGHTVIARTRNEFLGAGEIGYLLFTLTQQGHAMLAAAKGNQLLARATESNGSDRATARVVLVRFP